MAWSDERSEGEPFFVNTHFLYYKNKKELEFVYNHAERQYKVL